VTPRSPCSRGVLLLCAACVACTAASRRPEHAGPADAGARSTRPASPAALPRPPDHASTAPTGPGFPEAGPWLSFYGTALQMGDLARVAGAFRVIDVDADPGRGEGDGNFTDEELAILRNGGRNKVLSYLNIGSCERFRTYWRAAPAGLLPCDANRAARLGAYEGYPDETWMDPGNGDYQRLIVEHVAARLEARGVDGFYLDNLEIVEHVTPGAALGWCSPGCRQGGLDLVRKLRERFPRMLLVMQNATGETTRLGVTGGVPFSALLDGIVHEEVYSPAFDAQAERQLLEWQAAAARRPGERPLFIGVEDYVGSCRNTDAARTVYEKSRRHGFSPYVSDASASQKVVCYWPF